MSRRIALSLWMLAAILTIMTLAASGAGALHLPVSLLWRGSDETLRQIWLTIRLPGSCWRWSPAARWRWQAA